MFGIIKTKIRFAALLIVVALLTACPAPEFNHVIINRTDSILQIEYEYALPIVKYDSTQITAPAKMNFDQYENPDAEKIWTTLTDANNFTVESRDETATNAQTNQQFKQEIKTVKLALLPNEVLRVFVSSHMNIDLKNLRRIRLTGERGKIEIEGAGFEQFADYRPDRFFTDTRDYRIVYK